MDSVFHRPNDDTLPTAPDRAGRSRLAALLAGAAVLAWLSAGCPPQPAADPPGAAPPPTATVPVPGAASTPTSAGPAAPPAATQTAAPTAGPPATTAAPPATTAAPAATPTAATTAGPAAGSRPDSAPCSTGDQCASGTCEGQGCGPDEGRCVSKMRACTRDLRAYCGCDGQTFHSSGTCPGRPFSQRGRCP